MFGDIDRRDYPVDECGVWPKPYQLKKRTRRVADDESEGADGVGSDDDSEGDEEADGNNLDDGSDEEEEDADDGGEAELDMDLDLANEGHGMEVNEGAKADDEDDGVNADDQVVAEEVLEEPEPVAPVLIKGRWVCSECQKDEFLHFIDACAHEAACSGMQFAAVESL